MANRKIIMNILLAGGCGFIGSNLSIFLKKKKFKVVSVDNLSKKHSLLNEKRLKKNKVKNFKIDLLNKKKLEKINFIPDIIIDCAAEPAVEVSAQNPGKNVENNFNTSLNLLNLSKKYKSKFIFLSSSRVYSIPKSYKLFKNKRKKYYTEDMIDEEPKTIYGFSKYASELLIKEYSYAFNIKYIINRLGVVSGPWQFGKVEQGLVSLWLWNHFKKKSLNYIGFGGTGNQIRDVLYIDDLCDLIYEQIKKLNTINNLTFCVGGGKKSCFKLKELTKYCEIVTKNKVKINKIKKTSLYDIPYFVSSNYKISKYYNWKVSSKLENILKKTFNWMKINNKNLEKYFK